MRDLNFFESYMEKRQFRLTVPVVLYGLIILYAAYALFTGIYNSILINSVQKNVHALQAIAENPATLEKVSQIKELEAEVNTFEEEVNKIKEMDRIVEAGDIIDEEYLDLINSKMPDDLFFTNFSVSNSDIQISGIAKDRWSVAEFGKGLGQIENVQEVFVSNITAVEDYYRFSLSITLKEVIIYDENTV